MGNVTTDWNIWPSNNMDFWKLTDNANTITIKWTKNVFDDYKKLSYDFYTCGDEIFCEAIERDSTIEKSDMWFLSGVFLLRQSIELGLKALISRNASKDVTKAIFKDYKHNLSALFEQYVKSSAENFLTDEELDWLRKYFGELEYVDEKSDMFRFPFDNDFLQMYRDKFLDNEAIANNLLQAFSLVKKCLENGVVNEIDNFDSSLAPQFLILTNNGFGNCHVWQRLTDDGFYAKVIGYTDASEYIFHAACIPLQEKVYPLIFMLRNTVELSLKRVFYKRLEHGIPRKAFLSKRNSHAIKKDLWKNVKPVVLEYALEQGFDTSIIDTTENMLYLMDKIDKKGYTFRYPTTYELQYNFNNKTIDLRNVYEYFRAVINFLNGCDSMFTEISEFEADRRCEYKSYF